MGGRPRGVLGRAQAAAAVVSCAWALLAAACVPGLDVEDAPCPCAPGYRCCPVENRCQRPDEACPVSRNCPLPPGAESVLEIGAGSEGEPVFRPLSDGGRLPLHYGGQGGYHVYVQVRLSGLDPVRLELSREVFSPADRVRTRETALAYEVKLPTLYCEADRHFILGQDQALILCPGGTSGEAMFGRDLVLRVTAVDRAGRRLVSERAIHPVCPDGDAQCRSTAGPGCAAP